MVHDESIWLFQWARSSVRMETLEQAKHNLWWLYTEYNTYTQTHGDYKWNTVQVYIQVGRLYMENTASSDPRGPQHGAL